MIRVTKMKIQTPEKFDLMQMLAEIEDDIASETADLDQQIDISQDVISELVNSAIRKKTGAR